MNKSLHKKTRGYIHYKSMLQGSPVAKRVVVVTPSSLLKNWRDEIRKWLGDERLQAVVLQAGPDATSQASL